MDTKPVVSVVLTTKNEAANIENCLLSIQNQTYPHIETIVIDNHSVDKTKEIAQKYTDLVFDYGPERSAQRNYGLLKIARGKFGMYIDADMILSPSLIKSCVELAQRSSSISIYIPEIVLGKSFFSRIRRFERPYYEGTCIDAVRFFPISDFSAIKGFDEELFCRGSGEDWDLDKRLKIVSTFVILNSPEDPSQVNAKIGPLIQSNLPKLSLLRFTSRACVFHNESNLTFATFVRKKIYYSKAFEGYKNKWGKGDLDLQHQFGFRYRLFSVFFTRGHALYTLRNFHWYFCVIAYRLALFGVLALSAFSKVIKLQIKAFLRFH